MTKPIKIVISTPAGNSAREFLGRHPGLQCPSLRKVQYLLDSPRRSAHVGVCRCRGGRPYFVKQDSWSPQVEEMWDEQTGLISEGSSLLNRSDMLHPILHARLSRSARKDRWIRVYPCYPFNLSELLTTGVGSCLTLKDALAILRQIANSAAALEIGEWIHRDIKPSNVMIDLPGMSQNNFQLRLSRRSLSEVRTVLTEMYDWSRGTVGWGAPESMWERATELSSVFGLGRVAFALISRKPFLQYVGDYWDLDEVEWPDKEDKEDHLAEYMTGLPSEFEKDLEWAQPETFRADQRPPQTLINWIVAATRYDEEDRKEDLEALHGPVEDEKWCQATSKFLNELALTG